MTFREHALSISQLAGGTSHESLSLSLPLQGEIVIDPVSAVCSASVSAARKTFRFAETIPLLRTCAQIHQEATAMLYGSNQFCFGDEIHGYVELPECGCLQFTGIAYLHIWLHLIGKNLTKIRRIRTLIYSPLYLYYPGEIGLRLHNSDNKDKGKGSYLGKAFAILSQGHSLQNSKMSFYCADVELSDHLLGFGMNSLLVQQMAKVSGIREFLINPLPETGVGLDTWAMLKARMEGKRRGEEVDGLKSTRTIRGEDVDPADVSVVWDKLRGSVNNLNNGVKEITALVAKIEGRVRT